MSFDQSQWDALPLGGILVKGANGTAHSPYLNLKLPCIMMLPDRNRTGYFFFDDDKVTVPSFHPALVFKYGKLLGAVVCTHGTDERHFLANGSMFSVSKIENVNYLDMMYALKPVDAIRLQVRAQLTGPTGINAVNRYRALYPVNAEIADAAEKALKEISL